MMQWNIRRKIIAITLELMIGIRDKKKGARARVQMHIKDTLVGLCKYLNTSSIQTNITVFQFTLIQI